MSPTLQRHVRHRDAGGDRTEGWALLQCRNGRGVLGWELGTSSLPKGDSLSHSVEVAAGIPAVEVKSSSGDKTRL